MLSNQYNCCLLHKGNYSVLLCLQGQLRSNEYSTPKLYLSITGMHATPPQGTFDYHAISTEPVLCNIGSYQETCDCCLLKRKPLIHRVSLRLM